MLKMEANLRQNAQPNHLPWYSKYYKHLRNRNRISPGEIVIADTEFIDVGPRRHLRIICPPVKDNVFYENAKHDRPQSVNDNFFSRWSKRPHPSGNCRCSCRRSNRLSMAEEELICNEIQRIRTSLCEAEMNGQNIEEIEQTVYKNLDNLRAATPVEPTNEKIARDLDKYINDLLKEILCNTAHVLSEMDPSADVRVNFCCYDKKDVAMKMSIEGGYVNAGFVGSKNDLDDLNDFSEPNADYVDSGINSVETVELEAEQPSLEQSLMAIIDSKLGANRLDKSIEELHMEISVFGDNSHEPFNNDIQGSRSCGLASSSEADVGIVGHSFDKSRLEFTDEDGATCTRNVTARMNRTVSAIRDKLATSLNSKKNHKKMVKTVQSDNSKLLLDDSMTRRNNRKPMIVFLHGFGSSAEIFQHQLNYFSSIGYPCIAPDMLGHGFSSAPTRSTDYHFEKLLKDVDVVLNRYALEPGHKCVLVGHNYGCSFATSLASKYESQISQLILISGGGPTPLAPPNSEGVGHCFLRAALAPLLMCGLHRDILYSARGRQHPYCASGTQQEWPSHMKYVLNGMVWPNGDYAFHRRISTPTLLIHGLRDNSVSLVQECQMERTMIKALLEAIPTAGHSPMTDCPDQLNHMIHCFIDLWKNKK